MSKTARLSDQETEATVEVEQEIDALKRLLAEKVKELSATAGVPESFTRSLKTEDMR